MGGWISSYDEGRITVIVENFRDKIVKLQDRMFALKVENKKLKEENRLLLEENFELSDKLGLVEPS